MPKNDLGLKSVSELGGMKFLVPDYQRGYRWGKKEVERLLDDILGFATSRKDPFYCLQPLVVVEDKGQYRLIDGQQRLTTIYLILKAAGEKPLFELEYAIREGSKEFLEKIATVTGDDPDCFHIDAVFMYDAFTTIKDWFKNNAGAKKTIIEALRAPGDERNVRFIWYDLGKIGEEKEIERFTRLNSGKIPLTQAELVKALLLNSENFGLEDKSGQTCREQRQIASEWDAVSRALHDDAFWYFISDDPDKKTAEKGSADRMEYFFECWCAKDEPESGVGEEADEDDEESEGGGEKTPSVFELIEEKFKNTLGDGDIDKEIAAAEEELKAKKRKKVYAFWKQFHDFFLCLEGWYRDPQFYHSIGFLIATEKEKNARQRLIKELWKEYKGKKKSEFLDGVKVRIKREIFPDKEPKDIGNALNKITYSSPQAKNCLLLFNILTILKEQDRENAEPAERFAFDRYKKGNWDIEHIAPQTPKDEDDVPEGPKAIKEWAEDMRDYLKEEENDKKRLEEIAQAGVRKVKEVIRKHFGAEDPENDPEGLAGFAAFYEKIMEPLGKKYTSDIKELNKLSNLALLNSSINRSYKNAFFPVKRMRLIEEDKKGAFIPPATRSAFLKYYSGKFPEMFSWRKKDAEPYFKDMAEKFKGFFR